MTRKRRRRIPRVRYRRKCERLPPLEVASSGASYVAPSLEKYLSTGRGVKKILRHKVANIIGRHVRDGTEMVDHLVVLHDSTIWHYGIHGVRGWKDDEVQFKHGQADLEFECIFKGKFVQRWRRKYNRR